MLLHTVFLFLVSLNLGKAASSYDFLAQYCTEKANGKLTFKYFMTSSYLCKQRCYYMKKENPIESYSEQGYPCFYNKQLTCDGKGKCNGPPPNGTNKIVNPIEPVIQACYKEANRLKKDDYKIVTRIYISGSTSSKECKINCHFDNGKRIQVINSGEPCQLEKNGETGRCDYKGSCIKNSYYEKCQSAVGDKNISTVYSNECRIECFDGNNKDLGFPGNNGAHCKVNNRATGICKEGYCV